LSEPADAPTLLTVPNVSEGRNEAVIGRLAGAFAVDAVLLDSHSDQVHNRSVFTLVPTAGDVVPAVAGGARVAVEALDLTDHDGEHPRIGALDVAPVVWLHAESRDDAREQALRAADAIAALGVPVFLYGDLANAPERRERAYFRRGGLEELSARMADGLAPDRGPTEPHPTAGATLVTARPPLAAFNLELEGASLAATREVAAELRESGGGLPGVRAIGLEFGARTQVSTNVHDPIALPLGEVVARVVQLAAKHGARVAAGEVVGLVPAASLDGFPAEVPLPGFDRAHSVIEERIRGVISS
jgi:glutamate formiminotransferase